VTAFDVLGDPVRRRIVEVLARGEMAAGEITSVVISEFGITQPAVSRHLRILRESGFATNRQAGTRRLYALDPAGVTEARRWLDTVEGFWTGAMDALSTELARQNRTSPTGTAARTAQKEQT
jgi:DNA-binding transcriptional ArsR family regulator